MKDIIIFGGQSNMQGENRGRTRYVVPECAEYKWLTDECVPLTDPVGEDITFEGKAGCTFTDGTVQNEWLATHVAGSACYHGSTLVPPFAKAYTEACGRGVLAVPFAKGSTFLHDWLPGTKAYEMMLRKVSGARKYAEDGARVFFVFLQGENDAVFSRTVDEYSKTLTALKDALVRDLGLEKFGVISVGHFCGDARDDAIIEAQKRVCRTDGDFLLLTTLASEIHEREECMEPGIPGHFSEKGLAVIGEDAGRTLGEYVKQN